MNNIELLKKKILYRSEYRGTKEMDLLLSKFVKKYINDFGIVELKKLEDLLNFEILQKVRNFIIWNFNFSLLV